MSSLRFSEWVFSLSLVFILVSLFVIARIDSKNSTFSSCLISRQVDEFVSVDIQGAVKKPGVYKILKGASLGKVLLKSKPDRFADLKSFDVGLEITHDTEIFIPMLSEIHVRVEGAVSEPVDLILPVGTKVKDLKSKISFASSADLSVFKSKRMLKDQEIFLVPKKRVD